MTSSERKRLMVTGLVVCLLCSTAVAEFRFHVGDLGVARSLSGQLQVFNYSGEQILLPPVDGPLLFGWADNDPGLDHLEADEPEHDLYVLQIGAQIRIECVSIDPAFKVRSSNLAEMIDEPGDGLDVGDHELHEHLVWHIDSNEAMYDPEQIVWHATFKLTDAGSTGYADSAPFTMSFVNRAPIPTVSDWGIVIMVLLCLSCGTVAYGRQSARARIQEAS